jgi:hypothetical protein
MIKTVMSFVVNVYGRGKLFGCTPAVARRVALLIVALALVAPAEAAAQTLEQPPRFTSSVDVVSVTAVVRDRKGASSGTSIGGTSRCWKAGRRGRCST